MSNERHATVREMEYSIAEDDDLLGMTRIEVEPERTPAERLALRIINDPGMHSHGGDIAWWRLPHTGEIGKVKAEATKRKWERGRTIDGRRARFQATVFRERDGAGWGVAVAYDPDRQPKPKTDTAATDAVPQQPQFDGGEQFGYNDR